MIQEMRNYDQKLQIHWSFILQIGSLAGFIPTSSHSHFDF